MARELEIDSHELDELLNQALAGGEPVEAVIRVTDPEAAKYWATVEFGSTPGEKPWPRPWKRTKEKDGRIFSKQAPGGFANKYFQKFLDFLGNAAMRRISANKGPLDRAGCVDSVNDAAEQALKTILAGVPVDSGRLKNSIKLEKAK
jgi:hypothetical protein